MFLQLISLSALSLTSQLMCSHATEHRTLVICQVDTSIKLSLQLRLSISSTLHFRSDFILATSHFQSDFSSGFCTTNFNTLPSHATEDRTVVICHVDTGINLSSPLRAPESSTSHSRPDFILATSHFRSDLSSDFSTTAFITLPSHSHTLHFTSHTPHRRLCLIQHGSYYLQRREEAGV